MSAISFQCPRCGQSLEAPTEMQGTQTECPSCTHKLTIPAPARAPKLGASNQAPRPPSGKKKLALLLAPPLVTLLIGIVIGYAAGKSSSPANDQPTSSAQRAPARPTPAHRSATPPDDAAGRVRSLLTADIDELGSNPITGQETVTIEQVLLFYDKYAGQKLIFQGCSVHHDVENRDGVFVLRVTSRGGKYVSGINLPRFTMRESMAEQMAPHLGGGNNWPNCTLQCRLLDGSVIFVIGVDVYNAGGNIWKSFRNK